MLIAFFGISQFIKRKSNRPKYEGGFDRGICIRKGNPGIGTITDVDGNFSLDVNAAKATLQLTYVGYVTKEISLSEDKQGVIVEMNEDNFKLDEVVVTGQGAEIKKDVCHRMFRL